MINLWQLLAHNKLTSSGDVDSGTFLTRNWLYFEFYGIANNNLQTCNLILNNDTNAEYARRRQDNGSVDTSTSDTALRGFNDKNAAGTYIFGWIMNIDGYEKLIWAERGSTRTAGSGSIPDQAAVMGKYAVTSGQVTELKFIMTAGTDFAADSELMVWGTDDN